MTCLTLASLTSSFPAPINIPPAPTHSRAPARLFKLHHPSADIFTIVLSMCTSKLSQSGFISKINICCATDVLIPQVTLFAAVLLGLVLQTYPTVY